MQDLRTGNIPMWNDVEILMYQVHQVLPLQLDVVIAVCNICCVF